MNAGDHVDAALYTECTGTLYYKAMYFGIALLVVVSAASIEAVSEDFFENRNACIDILELDEEVYPKAKEDATSSEIDEFMTFDPDDYESLALWKCIMKKEKVVSPTGRYQLDALKEWLPEEIDASQMEECMTIKKEDPCDAAHLINKCVVEHLLVEESEEEEE